VAHTSHNILNTLILSHATEPHTFHADA